MYLRVEKSGKSQCLVRMQVLSVPKTLWLSPQEWTWTVWGNRKGSNF